MVRFNLGKNLWAPSANPCLVYIRDTFWTSLVDFIWQEQDKSSDIEQQPPFGDRKISNI